MTAPKFLTVEQAADYLNVSKSLMLRMVRDGRLTGYVNMAEIDGRVHAIEPRGGRVGADSHCSAARLAAWRLGWLTAPTQPGTLTG